MNYVQFKKIMNDLAIVRRGNGPLIAEKAGIEYSVYSTAQKGMNKNPKVLKAIVKATYEVLAEIKQIETVQ